MTNIFARRHAGDCAALALLLSAAVMACQPDPRADGRKRIDAWLQCEECVDGELAAVLALGSDSSTREATVDVLSGDLLAGPSPTRVANMQRQFLASFRDDSVYGMAVLGVEPVVSSTEYVDHYLDNFVTLFQTRAGLALARIGGAQATAALDSALGGKLRVRGDSVRSDAVASLRFARDSLLEAVRPDHPMNVPGR